MNPLLCIVGPTASGKTALAIALAEQVGGEVVSCDSVQLFRECDIVSAKPSLAEQSAIPHHLLDILNPDEAPSAALWAARADAAIQDIELRGKVPIVCGGTGFYLRALLQPQTLAVSPPNPPLRAELERQRLEIGAAAMHERLRDLDSSAAARLHPNDSQRVLRALEVLASPSGENAATWQGRTARIFALAWPREVLIERIHARIEIMVNEGALDETRALLDKWGEYAPALGSVGYKQLRGFLRGECDLEATLNLWQAATRQYAKRQGTWFRGQTKAHWLDGTRCLDELAAEVLKSWVEMEEGKNR